jgi:hypothetical protein
VELDAADDNAAALGLSGRPVGHLAQALAAPAPHHHVRATVPFSEQAIA